MKAMRSSKRAAAARTVLLLAIMAAALLAGCSSNCRSYNFGRNVRDVVPEGSSVSSRPITGWVSEAPRVITEVTNLESQTMELTYTPIGEGPTTVSLAPNAPSSALTDQKGNGKVSIVREAAFFTERGDGADVRFCFKEAPPPSKGPPPPSKGCDPYGAVGIPAARKFVETRWQRKSPDDSPWPSVLVVDDGFFEHPDLPIRPHRARGFPGGTSEGRQLPLPAYGAHGTGVISLIGAYNGNQAGIESVAGETKLPDGTTTGGCSLLPARAEGLLGAGQGMSPTVLAEAIRYWTPVPQLRVINVSQSMIDIARDTALAAALGEAQRRGILIVIGAGNDKKVRNERGAGNWLAAFDNILVVGGLDHCGKHLWSEDASTGTGVGSAVDLYAPAEDLEVIMTSTRTGKASGTSYATPIVSGVAALMLNVKPGIDARELKRLLLASADTVRIPGGRSVKRLNAERAVQAAARRGSIRVP